VIGGCRSAEELRIRGRWFRRMRVRLPGSTVQGMSFAWHLVSGKGLWTVGLGLERGQYEPTNQTVLVGG
jgi:hypothetical protein